MAYLPKIDLTAAQSRNLRLAQGQRVPNVFARKAAAGMSMAANWSGTGVTANQLHTIWSEAMLSVTPPNYAAGTFTLSQV